jgi:predicted nucleic acid-binding protein
MARRSKTRRNSRQPILLDTAFCVAVLRQRDQSHDRSLRWQHYLDDHEIRLVVTEAVLWELLDSCADPTLRTQAMRSYRLLHHDKQVEVVPFKPSQMQAAFALYESRPDKGWGLTDCLSFVVMQQRGLTDALTTDHDFVQAGFRALLLQDPPP